MDLREVGHYAFIDVGRPVLGPLQIVHGHSSLSQQHRPGGAESDLVWRVRRLHYASVYSVGTGRNPGDDTIKVVVTTCHISAFEVHQEADQLGCGRDAHDQRGQPAQAEAQAAASLASHYLAI